MQTSKLSVCYYPTTTILIDDKKSFLEGLELSLSPHVPLKTYSNPNVFLNYLQQDYQAKPFINNCLENTENNLDDPITTSINIRSIHAEIYNPDRFKQISVLVINYAMPSMNGLDCCKAITDPHIKKILLSGEADTDTAIEAFNNGLIHKFIPKNIPDLKNILLKAIQELQVDYFLKLSDHVHVATGYLLPACMSDPIFIHFFEEHCKKEKIVEYYLLDNYGSLLMINIEGTLSGLLVKTAEEIDNLLDIASMADAPTAIQEALHRKTKVPYFHSIQDLYTSPANWEAFLHPAKVLQGNFDYYYVFVTDVSPYIPHIRKTVSYSQFKKKTL